MLLYAECSIMDNIARVFETSSEIHPITGEYKMKAKTRTTNPGEFAEFPDDVAQELLAAGAARLPTSQELTLRAYATMEARDDIG